MQNLIGAGIRRSAFVFIAAAVVGISGCSSSGGAGLQAAMPTMQDQRFKIVGPGKGVIPDTWENIHNFQVFDGDITAQQAQQDAYRYDAVWGTGKPGAWKAGNSRIVTGYYAPFDGDFDAHSTLGWWRAHHASWVLYKCDKKTPAYPSGLLNIPLDISNPAVVAWQMQTYGPTIEADGYSGLAVDLVGLSNADGGCGVWVNGVWQQRFTGQLKDDAWSQAVLGWFHYAYGYVHSLPRPLILEANNVPENRPLGDPEQVDLLNHMDLLDDESAFTIYGNQYASSAAVAVTVGWMKYTQSIGRVYVVDDKWNTRTISHQQLGWSISTYLLGKYHAAALFTDHLPGYGYEYWFQQYLAQIGSPCGDAYVVNKDAGLYFRKYSTSLVVTNASISHTYKATLPQLAYVDIFGNVVKSPMTVPPDTGDVLIGATGCK